MFHEPDAGLHVALRQSASGSKGLIETAASTHELRVFCAKEFQHGVVAFFPQPAQAFVPGLELVLAQTQKLSISAIQDAREGVCQLHWTAPAEVHLASVVRVRWDTFRDVRLLKPMERAAH